MTLTFQDDFSDDELDKKKVKKLIIHFSIENTLILKEESGFSRYDQVVLLKIVNKYIS